MTQAVGNWQQHQGNWKGAWATQITNSRAPLAATALPGPACPLAFPHTSLITTPCLFHGSFQCLPNDEETEGLKGVTDLPKCTELGRDGTRTGTHSYQVYSLLLERAPQQQHLVTGRAAHSSARGTHHSVTKGWQMTVTGHMARNTKSVTIQWVFLAISK